MKSPPQVSGIVITFNEEAHLSRTLKSMKAWCDELVVVDSHSTDGTVDVARSCGARVVQHPFHSFVEQKNRAVEEASHDWILCLDADEELEPASGGERPDLSQPQVLYVFKRNNHYLGDWVRWTGWRRDSTIRLFNRTRARYLGEGVHERVGGEGCLRRWSSATLTHRPYRNLGHHLSKINRYSSGMAESLSRKSYLSILGKMVLGPPWKMLKMFILEGGFLMGSRGFVLSGMAGVYVFLKYAKAWEVKRSTGRVPS